MPEGDTIFRAARTLHAALAGNKVARFETVLPHLARVRSVTPLTGRTVEDVNSRGKWLTMTFSGDLILRTHMRMSGSWHVYRPGEKWHRRSDEMRIVIATESIEAVAFMVPTAEFHTSATLLRHPLFGRLGEDVLAAAFDERQAVTRLRSEPQLEVGDALLKQTILAGVGNVLKSEIAFACRISPFRRIASLSESELLNVVRTCRQLLQANVGPSSIGRSVPCAGPRRTTRRANPAEHLRVYGRAGQPCRVCGTPIHQRKQGSDARVTFWCPNCQPQVSTDN